MITKKTFVATAKSIKRQVDCLVFENYKLSKPLLVSIASDMADFFKKENPRFNRAKFMEACGLE